MKLLAIPVGFAVILLAGIKLFGLDHGIHRAPARQEAPGAAAAPRISPVKPDADIRAVISFWSARIGRDTLALHRAGRRDDLDRLDDTARRLRADCLRARSALVRQPATTRRGVRARRLAGQGFLLFARAARQLDLAFTTAYSGGVPAVLAHARRAEVLIVVARRDIRAAQALLSPNQAPSSDHGSQA